MKHKERIESDPFLTAIHEAAHAVACLRLKIKFSYITNRKRKARNGIIQFNRYSFNLTSAIAKKKIERIKRQIIMLKAGDMAEMFYLSMEGVNIAKLVKTYIRFLPPPGQQTIKDEDVMTDDESIDCFSDLIGLLPREKHELVDKAADLVIANWDHIKAVADVLEEKGRLKYFQVRKLWTARLTESHQVGR